METNLMLVILRFKLTYNLRPTNMLIGHFGKAKLFCSFCDIQLIFWYIPKWPTPPKMTNIPNLTNSQFGRIPIWQNPNLAKSQFGKIPIWPHTVVIDAWSCENWVLQWNCEICSKGLRTVKTVCNVFLCFWYFFCVCVR